jgi:hypothetical protein
MPDGDLRLDGNAAAGLLGQVFAVEATTAIVTCASCGASGAVGTVHVYDRGPGTILRCPACSAVLMRFAEIRGRLFSDLRGIGMISHPVDP